MSISLLLEMASSDPDREALVSNGTRLTIGELSALADGGAGVIATSGAGSVAYVGTGGVMLPLLMFSSARAARAFTPLNYRLSSDGLRELIERLPEPLVVFDDEYRDMVGDAGAKAIEANAFIDMARTAEPVAEFADPDDVAIVLFTSGTTSRPKAVELSHHNLTSYVMGTVEFASADADDAALIRVPPYHIAGVGAALSNLYAGRKMVYLTKFDAKKWIRLVRDEAVTTATVVQNQRADEIQNQKNSFVGSGSDWQRSHSVCTKRGLRGSGAITCLERHSEIFQDFRRNIIWPRTPDPAQVLGLEA